MNKHVHHIKAKALKRLPLLKCLAGRECGADRTVLIRIYKSLIRPILEYSCQVLDGPANKVVDSIDSVQNACLRVATGALRTSPVMPLLVETNVPPLYIRRWELTIRYGMKVMSVENHPCRPLIDGTYALPYVEWSYQKRIAGFPIDDRLRHISMNINIQLPQDVTHRASVFPLWQEKRCNTHKLISQKKDTIDPCDVLTAFDEFKNTHHGYHYIYTDGSKSERGVGCAIVHGNLRYKTKIKMLYSIFTAESVAVLQAVKYARLHCIEKCVICTDSMSVLHALQASESTHPLITDISDSLQILNDDSHDYIILWIPGHSGIPGNETADIMAKEAVLLPDEEEYEVSIQEYIPHLRAACHQQFNRIWASYDPPTNLKEIKDMAETWVSSKRTVRREEIVLCRLRLGHTRLTHSFLLDREPRPECAHCNCYLSVRHLLIDCIGYDDERQQLSALCHDVGVPMELRTILGDRYADLTDGVIRFLRDCDMFRKI